MFCWLRWRQWCKLFPAGRGWTFTKTAVLGGRDNPLEKKKHIWASVDAFWCYINQFIYWESVILHLIFFDILETNKGFSTLKIGGGGDILNPHIFGRGISSAPASRTYGFRVNCFQLQVHWTLPGGHGDQLSNEGVLHRLAIDWLRLHATSSGIGVCDGVLGFGSPHPGPPKTKLDSRAKSMSFSWLVLVKICQSGKF